MFHYFEAITNTKGDSLIGYFARVTDPATGNVVTIAADASGTPIETVSGVANMAKTDSAGNLSFYIAPGTYNLNIYASDAATFINQVPNVGMSQGTDGVAASIVSITANTLAPGSSATATNVGTSLAAQFVLGIPAGTPGTNGTNGTNGADGTTGNNYFGYGVPANNQYVNGDTYTDLSTGLVYGQKTGGKWPLGTNPDVNSATPSRTRIDMRIAGATLLAAQGSVSRASSSTDMLASDPYTYTPTTYGNNVAVIRPGKGLGVYQRSQQLLANPGTPATETVTVPVGVIAVLAWGPPGSQMVSSAGTAVGTGFGTLAGNAGVPQYITITTAGTITLTPTSLVKANVQYDPSLPASTEAVPYIASQSIREADLIAGGSSLMAALGSTQGYFLMGVSDMNVRNYGAPPCFLGMNGSPAWFAPSNTSVTIYDPANHSTNVSLGNDTFSTGTTVGRTWDGTATVTFGGGGHFEASHPFQHNNGAAVTAVCLGSAKTTSNAGGLQSMNGFIGWWEYATEARLSDESLWNVYTTQAAPKLDTLLKNYLGAPQFNKFIASVHQLRAGVIDHVKVGIIGPSHEGGVGLGGDTNIRSNSWSFQMLSDLEALDGYSVADAYCGTGSAAWSGGTVNHDNRMSYTGTAPTTTGVQFGRFVTVIPAGTVVSFNPGRQNSRFILYAYTNNTGYGSVEVSKDGGVTPLAATETGLTSNGTTSAQFTGSITSGVLTTTSTTGTIRVGDRLAITTGVPGGTTIVAQLTGTAGGDGTYSVSANVTTTSTTMWTKALIIRTYDTSLGNNVWSIKAVGNPVHVCLCYAYNPATKPFVFFNGGADGFNVTNLARDDDVETSYAYPVRVLGCSLWFGCGDATNDMASSGTPWATYNPLATSIITNAQISGSVVLFTDPESATTSYNRALSDKITAQERAVGFATNVPIYDFYAYYNSDPVKCQYDILNPNGAYNDLTHLSKRANKRFKSNQMRVLFNRMVGYA